MAGRSWDNLGFDPISTDYMYTMKCSEEGGFSDGGLQPFQSIQLVPSACVLNYGQVSVMTADSIHDQVLQFNYWFWYLKFLCIINAIMFQGYLIWISLQLCFNNSFSIQAIIEDLKAYKKQDDSILLFRPEEYGLCMRIGADRLCMPAPTIEQFVEAVKVTVLANRRWVTRC